MGQAIQEGTPHITITCSINLGHSCAGLLSIRRNEMHFLLIQWFKRSYKSYSTLLYTYN